LPCRLSDFALAPLFGIFYLLYSWWMMHSWVVVASDDTSPNSSRHTVFWPSISLSLSRHNLGYNDVIGDLGIVVDTDHYHDHICVCRVRASRSGMPWQKLHGTCDGCHYYCNFRLSISRLIGTQMTKDKAYHIVNRYSSMPSFR
jgi:hypothetical protein